MSALSVQDRYSAEQIDGFYESGVWQDTTFSQMIKAQADARPDKVFVFDSTTSYTYGELYDKTIRLAAGLRRAGIQPGDKVAVQMPNYAEFVPVMTAISRARGIIVPIMPIYRGAEVAYVIEHSGAKAVITVAQFNKFDYAEMYRGIQEQNANLETIYTVRAEGGSDVQPLEALVAEGDLTDLEAELGEDLGADEHFLIVYTSGTTARPKGCGHTLNTARSTAMAMADELAYSENDIQFGPSPVAHSTGMITSILIPLVCGASTYFVEAWEPNDGMQRLIDNKVTCAVTATAFLQMLLSVYDPDKHDPGSMRVWVCAGSPIPGSVVTAAGKMFSNGQVLSLYGRSENYVTTMVSVTDPPERSVTSDGRHVPHAEVKVVGEDGMEVPRGQEGDIAYKGPSHMLGYYKDPDETAALFTPEGFSRSGDLGRMDEDGFVRVTGRTKDIIIRGGMNISARELEDHLLHLDGVANVAAVGMPDERLGEKVCVYVVPKPGADVTLEEAIAHLKAEGVATQKLPERIEIVDALPMTATGKIQKHVLRDMVSQKLQAESGG